MKITTEKKITVTMNHDEMKLILAAKVRSISPAWAVPYGDPQPAPPSNATSTTTATLDITPDGCVLTIVDVDRGER